MRQRVARLVTRRHTSFGSLAHCEPRRVSVRVERTVWSLVNTQGPGRRRSNDSFIAERREPPGRARLRVGCRMGQFGLGTWFGRSACALPLIEGTSCSKASLWNPLQRCMQFPVTLRVTRVCCLDDEVGGRAFGNLSSVQQSRCCNGSGKTQVFGLLSTLTFAQRLSFVVFQYTLESHHESRNMTHCRSQVGRHIVHCLARQSNCLLGRPD